MSWTLIDTWSTFSNDCDLIGCLDVNACNYNKHAWINDSLLCNYDSYNNVSINSCEYYLLTTTILYLFQEIIMIHLQMLMGVTQ